MQLTDQDAWSLHDAACERGEATYTDPQTGFMVFTRIGLRQRGKCCGAGCRHCPFEHESVPTHRRSRRIQQPAWLTDTRPQSGRANVIVFWSGGKDSFLAYRAFIKEGRLSPILLTTFDARTRMIAHQEFSIDEVVLQAEALQAPLIGVPLHSGADYIDQLVPALDLVPDCTHLAFGDLHLTHIRKWRQQTFASHERTAEMALEFPLWKADYGDLAEDITASGAACVISAISVDLPGVKVGDLYDAQLMAKLPTDVDAFGENGEFHTRIVIGNDKMPQP